MEAHKPCFSWRVSHSRSLELCYDIGLLSLRTSAAISPRCLGHASTQGFPLSYVWLHPDLHTAAAVCCSAANRCIVVIDRQQRALPVSADAAVASKAPVACCLFLSRVLLHGHWKQPALPIKQSIGVLLVKVREAIQNLDSPKKQLQQEIAPRQKSSVQA